MRKIGIYGKLIHADNVQFLEMLVKSLREKTNAELYFHDNLFEHKNIFMVLCGHASGEAVLTSKGEHGNQVHQVLSDYQNLHNGGESWLRYMVFEPSENKIKVYTYNPALKKFRNQPSSRFDLEYSMDLSK